MKTKTDVLKVLAEEKNEKGESVPIAAPALAKKVGNTGDAVRSQLSALKKQGYVDGSGTDGWWITSDGIEALESGLDIVTTPQEVGAETKDKLRHFGQLAGVPPDTIQATIEAILGGDAEDLVYVWQCMTDLNVELTSRRKWINSWRYYLKQGIPANIKEKVLGATEVAAEEKGEAAAISAKDKGRDYIIVDETPIRVGPDGGDYSLSDAKDIIQSHALRARFAGTREGGGNQGWTPKDFMDFADKLNERRGDGATAKVYAFEQTEQGMALKEVTPGTPLNLNPPGGKKEQPLLIVDEDGVIQEMKVGTRVAQKKDTGNHPERKTTLIRQTANGMVKEEYPAGEVIIMNNPAPAGGQMNWTPFPVFNRDGKPVLDSEGKAVYADIEPTLRWLGFQGEQRRADERQNMLSSLVKTVRENIPDGIAAIQAAAAEARKERGGTAGAPAQPRSFTCKECGTMFAIPNVDFERIGCPKCKHEYTKAEVGAA